MRGTMLQGEHIRLVAEDAKSIADSYSEWTRDSEYWRLMTTDNSKMYSKKASQRELENFLEKKPSDDIFFFNIRTLEDDRLIGDVSLDGINWWHGESFVGISIADRSYWGRGYGTEAMKIIIAFGFEVLNLRRITLNVFAYNPRAIRSYEKVGFKHEGRVRSRLLRDGQRWDMVYMGLLRDEWQNLKFVS